MKGFNGLLSWYRFSDKFKTGINSYVSLNNTNEGANDALINAYFLPPTVSPYDKDGSYLFNCQPTSSKINPFVQIENNKREKEANSPVIWNISRSKD